MRSIKLYGSIVILYVKTSWLLCAARKQIKAAPVAKSVWPTL